MFGFAKKLVKQAEGIIAPEVQSNEPTYGFRVLYVRPDSEAFHAKIDPFFDFIIAVNGYRFQSQYYGNENTRGAITIEQEQSPADEFENIVKATEERLVLEIWCSKGKSTRVVTLPNPNKTPNGIGLSVRWSQLSVADHVWHVLNVVPTSPADKAGLISHADYVVAAENGLLDAGGEHLLGKVVSRANVTEGILFYVYNRDYDVVRPVRVHPSFDGKLGCGVGYGFLHALPAPSASSRGKTAPGAMLFDEAAVDDAPTQFLDTSVRPPMPDIVPNSPPKPKVHHSPHHAPLHSKAAANTASDLSEYFTEQSQISKEIDGTSKTSQIPVASVPPPPSAK